MIELLRENPEIYRIDIPLKGNALKNLNCYVLKSGGESVVIDTGFNRPDCMQALEEGLAELGISMDHTNLLITHLHTDHCGLAPGFAAGDSRIFMSKAEHELVRKWRHRRYRREMDVIFRLEGFPEEGLIEAAKRNPMIVYAADTDYDVVPLRDGDKIEIGDMTFTALAMSGHTPEHMCYYLEKEKIMFLGDHILFDITPNITIWPGVKHSLSTYLTNLHRILTYDIETAYPAHRGLMGRSLQQRVEEITEHHSRRLNEILDVLKEYPGSSGYEIASRLTWALHGETWETAPKRQIWFAVGETLAHIEYLMDLDKVFRGNKIVNGRQIHTYFLENHS